jgi:hypothetical protein
MEMMESLWVMEREGESKINIFSWRYSHLKLINAVSINYEGYSITNT